MAATTSPIPIIVDTDPGTDDLFALLWLAALQRAGACKLLAVTTCEGNVGCEQTYVNAVRALPLMGLGNIPIGKGRPTGKETAAFHGADGLAGLSKMLPEAPTSAHSYADADFSVDLLVQQLLSHEPRTVTVIAIGPCTNLAAAEKQSPGILARARQIVIMGGAVAVGGNITALSEFNAWFDPAALEETLNCGAEVMVLPLDVTTDIQFQRHHFKEVQLHLNNHISQLDTNAVVSKDTESLLAFVSAVLEVQLKTGLTYRVAGGKESMLVHDGATIVGIFYPECLRFQRAHLYVDTGEVVQRHGHTYTDNRHTAMRPLANAYVACAVEGPAAIAYMIEDLKSLFVALNDEQATKSIA